MIELIYETSERFNIMECLKFYRITLNLELEYNINFKFDKVLLNIFFFQFLKTPHNYEIVTILFAYKPQRILINMSV